MNRDDVIRWAREAGLLPDNSHPAPQTRFNSRNSGFFDFAALVAAAERQRLHEKFMEIHKSQQHSNNYWHFAARKIKEEA